MKLLSYKGVFYPAYLAEGNAMQYIEPTASKFCIGRGLDVGCSEWPFPGAEPIDLKQGSDALKLPGEDWDYIFSSHCLEHLTNPVEALEHWFSKIRKGGVLFLYLPHPDMEYWRPQNCRKHLHIFHPQDIARLLRDIGLVHVMCSERDLVWSFAAVGEKP